MRDGDDPTPDRDEIRQLEASFLATCHGIAADNAAHRRRLAQFDADEVHAPSPWHREFASAVVEEAGRLLGLRQLPRVCWVTGVGGFLGFHRPGRVALIDRGALLSPAELCVTCIHEAIHEGRPDWTEEHVERLAQQLAPAVLAFALRRVGPGPTT